jgi:hypothetical protein
VHPPAFACGSKGFDHIARQADGDALFGDCHLGTPAAQGCT